MVTAMKQIGQPPEEKHTSEAVQWRMRWYPRATLGVFGVAFLMAVMLGNGASTEPERLGGDYPAFYAAGRIAVAHDWEHLYEVQRQKTAQRDLYPDEMDGQYLYFAYPPFVAAAYAPLTLLPYRISYLLHTLLMAGAVAASIWIAGTRIPILRRYGALSMVLALLFYPLYRAITGGQNTALTLFLLVVSWRLVTDRHDFYAGLVLALLLFKPQYAVPMMLLYLVAGRWRVLVGSLVGAGVLYAAGASVVGPKWLVPWWVQAREFSGSDVLLNGLNNISFIGFVENLSDSVIIIVLLGLIPALAVVGALALSWLRGHPDALADKMALAAIGLILISPHTLYYDGALVLITLVILEARNSPSPKRIAAIWVVALFQMAVETLGWSPFFFVVLGIAVWAAISLGPGLFRAVSPTSYAAAG